MDSKFTYAGHMAVMPNTRGLSAVRRTIRMVTLRLNFCEDDADDILIAVGEAISNAYLHGSPDHENNFIRVGWSFEKNILTFVIKDSGNGFLNTSHAHNLLKVKGMGCGIQLMQKSVDEVDFQFNSGTSVVLKKRPAAGNLMAGHFKSFA